VKVPVEVPLSAGLERENALETDQEEDDGDLEPRGSPGPHDQHRRRRDHQNGEPRLADHSEEQLHGTRRDQRHTPDSQPCALGPEPHRRDAGHRVQSAVLAVWHRAKGCIPGGRRGLGSFGSPQSNSIGRAASIEARDWTSGQ
jgi:hypothetical protein